MADITIDNIKVEIADDSTILDASREAGIYIPVLCSHPDLKPFGSIELSERVFQGKEVFENDTEADIHHVKGCGICVVEVEGREELIPSCKTVVETGMVINTKSPRVIEQRKKNLVPIMTTHPHSCLTCDQREGCLTLSADCSNSVVLNERCCEINGNCEFQRLSDYVGIASNTPKYHPADIPRIEDEGLFIRDYNLCTSCGRCVRACQQLRNVYALGAVIHNGKLKIGTVKGEYLTDADCRFCGACVEVCPTGAIQDKRIPRLKDYKDFLPCRANCPGDTDIPAYLRYIAEGNPQASAEVITSKLTFAHSLGKMCFHTCETDCRRKHLSGSLNIRGAKDYAMSNSNLQPPERQQLTNKKVAVIGSGPAGLTAAYFLSLKGHDVIVHEKEEEIGGMLRYGIPDYRLSPQVLKKDIDRILQSGIEVRVSSDVGSSLSITSMLNDGFDAVLLATGLSKSKMMSIDLPSSDNIFYGIEFLNSAAKGIINEQRFKNREIVIIGGGNVASDAARTAVRLGASSVKMICLESLEEMPAYKQEINEAKEEGIEILNQWGLESISENGKMKLNLVRCISVFDDKRNFSPKYNTSEKNEVSADSVIFCIGQDCDLGVMTAEEQIVVKNGLINTIGHSAKTEIKGLYSAGDMVSGPKSVIDAIGSAKQAAREIDEFLGGDGIISGDDTQEVPFDARIGTIPNFYNLDRKEIRVLSPEDRRANFNEVEICYTDDEAREETIRCLQCNLRMKISQNPFPPKEFEVFSLEKIEELVSDAGVVQLLNSNKEVFLIKGSDDVRRTLTEFFNEGKQADYFICEYDQLFSQRESELVQQYLQKHGEMPDSGDDLDDLF